MRAKRPRCDEQLLATNAGEYAVICHALVVIFAVACKFVRILCSPTVRSGSASNILIDVEIFTAVKCTILTLAFAGPQQFRVLWSKHVFFQETDPIR
jgi:hypothetical protein